MGPYSKTQALTVSPLGFTVAFNTAEVDVTELAWFGENRRPGLGGPVESAQAAGGAYAGRSVEAGGGVARGRAFAVEVAELFVDSRLAARPRAFAVAVAVAALGDVI